MSLLAVHFCETLTGSHPALWRDDELKEKKKGQ